MALNDQVTKIKDIIQPDLFAEYVIDKTTEKSEIMNAGVVQNNPKLDKLITGGGTIFTMPKWNDLTGKSQVLSDTKPIEVGKITSKSELATLLIRTNAWGAHDLSGALAGDDPMKAIAELVSDWWVRDEKSNIMSILKGIFLAEGMDKLTLDMSTLPIDANMIFDGKELMGDASGMLRTLYMHSLVYTDLQKQRLIETNRDPVTGQEFSSYLGYNVVVDDSAPYTGSADERVFTTYLLSEGCIQRGKGTPVDIVEVETDRDSLGSTDILINRQAKILHPKGISWVGSGKIADSTPSDTELATGTNWKLVSDIKKIGIVQIKHKIQPARKGA